MQNHSKIISDGLFDKAFKKHGVSVWVWPLVFGLGPMVVLGVIALASGRFFSDGDQSSFLNNYHLWANVLIGVPAVVVSNVLLLRYGTECLKRLNANNVFDSGDRVLPDGRPATMDEMKSRMEHAVSNRVWSITSIALSAMFMGLAVPQHLKGTDWIVTTKPAFWFMETLWLVAFAMAALLIIRATVTVWSIRQAFKFLKIKVHPLHPDGCGGLAPLNRFVMQIGRMIFVFGLVMAVNQLLQPIARGLPLRTFVMTPDLVVSWIVYGVFSMVAFFTPLTAAHDSMLAAKDQESAAINERFDFVWNTLQSGLRNTPSTPDIPATTISTSLKDMKNLKKLSGMVEEFPVWPFQAKKLAQYVGTVSSPIVLDILPEVLKRFFS